MAEREGFEPSTPFWGAYAFQAYALSHSAISPLRANLICPTRRVCATSFVALYPVSERLIRHWLISNFKARHFRYVTHQNPSIGNCRMIPGLALNCLKARNFFVPLGCRFDQRQFAIATEDY